MARLTNDTVQTLLKSPSNEDAIKRAREHEDRLVFHCEPVQDSDLLPVYAKKRFFEWVDSFLPKDKAVRFKQLLTLPVDTVESTKAIFDELGKFMEAQDRYINYEFTAEPIQDDFTEFSEQLKDDEFWRKDGLQQLRTRVNSMLVIDCPAVQRASRPEPYAYFVDIHSIIDTQTNAEDGRIEYIIFKRPKDGYFIVIDDEFYRVYKKEENKDDYTEVSAGIHSIYNEAGELIEGLGYCPVTQFYNNPIFAGKGLNNRGPVSDVLGKLDWLLFWRTSKKYLDLYGAYPIIVTYKSTCEYRDEKDNPCQNGIINTTHWNGEDWSPAVVKCPACSSRQMIGPGSSWEVDAPADADDVDMLKNPVNIVEMGQDKLDYGVTEIERLESEIYLDCVGYDGEVLEDQAVNTSQVKANFESKKSVLDGIRMQFERANKFKMETICRLRYARYFKSLVMNYGSEYFLRSTEDLTKEYDDARKSGMPFYYLWNLRRQVSQTRFKNNPQQMQRDEILSQLEPYTDLSMEQIMSLQVATTDPEGYTIKINFNSFIQRFEREQADIVMFGSLLPLGKKILLITQKLQEYARQKQAAAGPRPEPGANGGPTA